MMKYITIPKLYKYQHYKEQKPIWIKLYCNILYDQNFNKLTSRQKWIYIGLIIALTQNNNSLQVEPKWLTNCLGLASKSIHKDLRKMAKLKLISLTNTPNNIERLYTESMPIREDKIRKDKNVSFKLFKPLTKVGELIKNKFNFKRK